MTSRAALVTGSSRGIGKGIALALASAGFHIGVNAGDDSKEIHRTVAEIQELGVKAVAIVADVAVTENHTALLEATEAALGPLTTLVNNAGVSVLSRGDLLDVTTASYDRCQAVNTRGAFFLTQAWAKRILARRRDPAVHHCVITVSSANAQAASIQRGEYCVSKAAVSMVAQLFAVRLGGEGIGSYEIQPGLIDTAMTAPALKTYQEQIDQGMTVTPRLGQPQDVGSVARAMATGQLAFCVGQSVQADGGLLIPRF